MKQALAIALFLFLASPSHAIQLPLTKDDMDALTQQDAAAVRQYYATQFQSCTAKGGTEETCGEIKNLGEGDPRMNSMPYYNKIPTGMLRTVNGNYVKQSAQVITACDKRTGQFYTTIYYRDKKGNWTNFKNPLAQTTQPQNTSLKVTRHLTNSSGYPQPVSTSEERWLTSPGLYGYKADGTTSNNFRTELQPISRGEGYITEWHVVSKHALKRWKEWDPRCDNPTFEAQNPQLCEPPKMPWSSWVDGSYAYHASNNVTGYPESHGCLRLQDNNALALFNLVRRVGTNNVTYHWQGYGETNPATGLPYCAGPKGRDDNQYVAQTQGSYQQISQKSAQTRKSFGQRMKTFWNWFTGGKPKTTPSPNTVY